MSRRQTSNGPAEETQVPRRTLRRRPVTTTFEDEYKYQLIVRDRKGKENSLQTVSGTPKGSSSTRRRSVLRQNEICSNEDDDDGKLSEIEEEPLPDEFTESLRPSALLGGEEDGPMSVGFQTPRRRKSMFLKAQESASKFSPLSAQNIASPPKTPSLKDSGTVPCTPRNRRVSIGGEMGATPSKGIDTPIKSALKRKSIIEEHTPRSQGKAKRTSEITPRVQKVLDLDAKTPRALRTRTRALIQKCFSDNSSDEDFSSDEEDDFKPDESSSSDDGEEMEEEVEEKEKTQEFLNSKIKGRTKARELTSSSSRVLRRNVKEEVDYDISTDAYFETQSAKQITSNNTLSRLRNPRLQQDALHKLLEDVDASHRKPITELSKEYLSLTDNWLFSLWEGYNILLYGVGSKRHLLQSIHQEVLKDCNVLIVNGFFPGLTMKQVVEDILTDILEVKDIPSNVLECVDVIQSIQSKKEVDPIYLLVHNLDGAVFRNDKAQTAFSRLAQIPSIHLIASIDHINAPLLWDQAKLRRFNFVWWDVTTFMAYTAETSYESSLLIQQSGALALSSLGSVFKSLIPNAKKVFILIAKNQLENSKNQSFTGISFQDLYWRCRTSFLASSDKVLRAQLTEFLDHNLLKSRRGADGVETLIIPIEGGILSQFLETQEQGGNI